MSDSVSEHVFPVRVYYEDTDAGGVVYHSNYLCFAERARTELLRDFGIDHTSLMADDGLMFAVRRCEAEYVKPARLGQRIKVEARLSEYELRLKIDYLITDFKTGGRLTKGYTVQVAVDMEAGDLLLGSPPVLYQRLGIAT